MVGSDADVCVDRGVVGSGAGGGFCPSQVSFLASIAEGGKYLGHGGVAVGVIGAEDIYGASVEFRYHSVEHLPIERLFGHCMQT